MSAMKQPFVFRHAYSSQGLRKLESPVATQESRKMHQTYTWAEQLRQANKSLWDEGGN